MKKIILGCLILIMLISSCKQENKNIDDMPRSDLIPSIQQKSCEEMIIEGMDSAFKDMQNDVKTKYPFDDQIYAGDICFCKRMQGEERDWCIYQAARKHLRKHGCSEIQDSSLKKDCFEDPVWDIDWGTN